MQEKWLLNPFHLSRGKNDYTMATFTNHPSRCVEEYKPVFRNVYPFGNDLEQICYTHEIFKFVEACVKQKCF